VAVRARLTAPRPSRTDWPWHSIRAASVSASLVFSGDRRLEAENFLDDGFKVRTALETRPTGWARLHEISRVWQPGRLKGIQLGQDAGVPFMAATHIFDVRPVVRKWLSLDRTEDHASRSPTAHREAETAKAHRG